MGASSLEDHDDDDDDDYYYYYLYNSIQQLWQNISVIKHSSYVSYVYVSLNLLINMLMSFYVGSKPKVGYKAVVKTKLQTKRKEPSIQDKKWVTSLQLSP